MAMDRLWAGLAIVLGALLLLPVGSLLGPEIRAGHVASRDHLAPQDVMVLDEAATQQQREQARQAVLPVYDFDPMIAPRLDEELIGLFARGRALLAIEGGSREGDSDVEKSGEPEPVVKTEISYQPEALVEVLTAEIDLKVTPEQFELLQRREFSTDLEDLLRGLVGAALRGGVVDDKAQLLENRMNGITLRNLQSGRERVRLDLYEYRSVPEEVREYFASAVRQWSGWSRAERDLVVDLMVENVPANIYLNRSETAARRDRAFSESGEVYREIRKGQVIVRKGDLVDGAAVRALDQLGTNGRKSSVGLTLLGNAVLVSLAVLLLWLSIRIELSRTTIERGTFGGILLLTMLSLIMVKLGLVVSQALAQSFDRAPFDSAASYSMAIPFAALSLIVSLSYGRPLGLVTGVSFAVLAGRMVGEGQSWAILFALVGSLAAVFSLDRLKRRSAVTRAGLVVGAVNALVALMLGMVSAGELTLSGVGFDAACAFVGGILVAAVASFAVPILESVLSVTTDIKLMELSDTNLPLLRRVAFEAPGTFQHSLMVANLAKVGCEAIEANSVLAYTAGLYHDIGKVLRPQYFAENQPVGENLHDKLAPSMSSLIVISHVKEGVELAREYGLPRPIIDAIQQHHGTSKLAFFLNRAKERSAPDGGEVSEADYRYPGPKPQSKVMGVLMLADGVEAASRVLRNPTPARIRNLVRELLEDCLEQDQLDQCDLTLRDLRAVTDAFCRVLESIYHKRVEYPGFDFNNEREPFRVVGGSGGSS